jgi:hypothetical protein
MKARKRGNTKVIMQEEAKSPSSGGILKALRPSPQVGADLDLARGIFCWN